MTYVSHACSRLGLSISRQPLLMSGRRAGQGLSELSSFSAAQPAYGSSCQTYRYPQHLYVQYQIHSDSFFPAVSSRSAVSIIGSRMLILPSRFCKVQVNPAQESCRVLLFQHRQRIHLGAIDDNLKVYVGSGASSRIAAESNPFALLHALSHRHQHTA